MDEGLRGGAALHERVDRVHRASTAAGTAPSAFVQEAAVSCGQHRGVGVGASEYGEAVSRFEDQLYFLIVVLRQVVRGRELMEHFGFPMPQVRQAALIQSWRNIAEHWDDPPKGIPVRSMKSWTQESDESHPGLSHTGAGGRLRTASGLNVRKVRKDLRVLRAAIGEVSEAEWHHCYITEDEAAEILGLSTQDFLSMSSPPMSMDFEGDVGVRYWREWVEARAAGHLAPPRWLAEGWVRFH